MLRFFFWIAGLLLAGMAQAAGPVDPRGHWIARTDGRALMIFSISSHEGGRFRGLVRRPERLSFTGSGQAYNVGGPTVDRAFTGLLTSSSRSELTLSPKAAGGAPDVLILDILDADHAMLSWKAFPGMALPLVRTTATERVGTGWDPKRRYPVEQRWPSNAEAAALFGADQAARLGGGPIDWDKVSADDARRRARMRELLDAGQLRSGDDFYHAAFVFQHGSEPGDYLLAHSFAVAAAARGRSDAAWIASATFDRYLQAIDRPQIYGTQYNIPDNEPANQEPYDRRLVPDSLRRILGVPSLAEQEARRREMEQAHRPGPGR